MRTNGIAQRDIDRFWSKVDTSGECWVWIGHRNKRGYGAFHIKDRLYQAHRLSWEIANSPIPEGLYVCHHCDNPSCVRPDHLFVGTPTDNIRDAIQKGRWHHSPPPKGRRFQKGHPVYYRSAKLTADQVREIRRLHDQGGVSKRKLAVLFGISRSNIQKIVWRRTWLHIED